MFDVARSEGISFATGSLIAFVMVLAVCALSLAI
jgi:hypothetical protein